MQQAATLTGTEITHEELSALQAQNRSLQLLVGELLVTNQQLRAKLARHEPSHGSTASAAVPPSPNH